MSDSSSDDEDYDLAHEETEDQRYPLHDACEFQDLEVLRSLLWITSTNEYANNNGDDDDDEDSSENEISTLAAHAVAVGHSSKLLTQNIQHADPSLASEAQDTAATTAATARSTDISSEQQDTVMIEATESKQLDATASTPPPKTTPPNASETKETRYKIAYGVNLNERDDDENTPLHVAIHARKIEHVKLLIKAGDALDREHEREGSLNLRMKCDGSPPIHTAISMGALKKFSQFAYECVSLLHEAGADLGAKDDSMCTPLYLACMYNLPQIASYILSDPQGLETLNVRADRSANRPLHAAAKYDTLHNQNISSSALATATGSSHDLMSMTTTRPVPNFPGKKLTTTATLPSQDDDDYDTVPAPSSEALLTQVLLSTTGIEVDCINTSGQSPLHVACSRGNWPVVRLLLQAGASTTLTDKRGYTPGQLAYKRGMPIPHELVDQLGDPPEETGNIPPVRDLIVDPNGSTLILTHELCMLHRSCPPIRRGADEPPPENVRRLHVLIDKDTGIFRTGEFGNCSLQGEARRAAMADVLKVHDYRYIESISQHSSAIPDIPTAISHLDPDTAISRWSFEAAMRAAGSVCQAVDQVIAGEYRNAFCAIRPPGHHAGPNGIVHASCDPEGGSHGFCLLNNVAIGAAYARSMYRNEGISKIAIIDFDVHHGNGTEEIVRQLVPTIETTTIRTPFATGELSSRSYRPWLDETDINNVFFSSTHGFGPRGYQQPGWFYPASGKSSVSESISNPSMVDTPNLTDFLLSQTWARMGDESKANCCKIINVGFGLPEATMDKQLRSMKQRLEVRETYRRKILPYLREFDPDFIFISAGFDAHRSDSMNFGYVGMVEDDYEWITEQLVRVANTCCNGRIVSVLEGGYKVHGGIVSPFARSVASHVRALVDGGRSREPFDSNDLKWESQHETHMYERRKKKREEEEERMRLMKVAMMMQGGSGDGAPEDPDAPSRKRRRNQVDYKELYKQMQQEGFG